MRRLLLPLLTVSVLGAAPQGNDPVRRWVDAALAHRPGHVDEALVDVATGPLENLRIVAWSLPRTLERDFVRPEARNDVRRRGALLHTDIALLLPDQAEAFKPAGDWPAFLSPDAVVVSRDGQFVGRDVGSGHWSFASWLLGEVTPDPSSDEFVRLWYRAVAAFFQGDYRFGSSGHHLKRAKKVLPRDPILLFYEGAMYEALASPRFQNVPTTAPGIFSHHEGLPSEDDQLREAQRCLREAVSHGAPPEARLRLGRVVGQLGKHAEAVDLLEQTVVPGDDARLAYLHALFLGTEQGALGRIEEARASFERAATLFPTAQAPLIAMSDLYRRSGDRASALDALRRLQALPVNASQRTDPWWDYHRSYAADAENQLAAVRAWVDVQGAR